MASSSSQLGPKQTGIRRIRQPPEVWVDVFKHLSRRELLRSVQPTCQSLHAIAELYVDNVHIVHHVGSFLDGLEQDLPEANKQCEELAASDASLAKHFRLAEHVDFYMEHEAGQDSDGVQDPARAKRRTEAQMSVLRHSLELFHGCLFHLVLHEQVDRTEILAYLELLQLVRPFYIQIDYQSESLLDMQPDQLLGELTLLSCPRLIFFQYPPNMLIPGSICSWLHHLPEGENGEEQGNQTRIFSLGTGIETNYCAEIIECCRKRLQESISHTDRRAFLFNFLTDTQQTTFRFCHEPTGEVLYLELFVPSSPTEDDCYYSGHNNYRLRRCLDEDLATADQFYRDTFRDDGFFFRTPIKDGLRAPTLTI